MKSPISLKALKKEDCSIISNAFTQQGWNKPISLYLNYLKLQAAGKRDIIIATYDDEFAGYLTVNWKSDYPLFKASNIPEIVDFNVLQKYQRRGIGTLLMDEAERRIKQVSKYAGIGFGLYKDYGPAQILYIKRNYIPDGNGFVLDGRSLRYGEQISVSDDIALYLIKEL